MNSYNVISENSDIALSAHRLVKFTSTGVTLCGADGDAIGTTLNDTAINTAAAIALRKCYGLHYVTVGSGTDIAAGDELDQAADGKVVKAAGGKIVGVAREANTEAGGIINAYLYAEEKAQAGT